MLGTGRDSAAEGSKQDPGTKGGTQTGVNSMSFSAECKVVLTVVSPSPGCDGPTVNFQP